MRIYRFSGDLGRRPFAGRGANGRGREAVIYDVVVADDFWKSAYEMMVRRGKEPDAKDLYSGSQE
jgi:hypothetical protein